MKICIVIPCYKVKDQIMDVLLKIPFDKIDLIYLVDDACPLQSLNIVKKNLNLFQSNKIVIIKNNINLGVGGAMKKGYQQAIKDNMDIAIKVDGDDQMDLNYLDQLIKPILLKDCDYTKGNRFYSVENLKNMPGIRIFGNAVLTFLAKFSSGYWSISDPTNGYTAISVNILKLLPFDKISNRYFFENDILFRLNTIRAKVNDIPMKSVYKNEVSNLKVSKIIFEFLFKLLKNFLKRIFYNYYLRNINIGSFTLPLSIVLLYNGLVNGYLRWSDALDTNLPTPTGTIMIYILSIVLGTQFFLNFLDNDIRLEPKEALLKYLN